MPGRQVNLRGPKDESSKKSKKGKIGRSLDALAIAESEYPSKPRIKQSRLGESDEISKRKRNSGQGGDEWQGPDTKRRKTGDESDSSDNYGSDSEGHEWKIGQVDSDDDSELDSDEAFGSSDEERFEGFTFRGSSSTKSKPKRSAAKTKRNDEIDLSENDDDLEGSSEDESEDDLGEDAVDLATAWDMNAEEEESQEASSKSNKNIAGNTEDGSESEEDYDDLSDDSGLSFSDDEEDAENQRGLSKLQSFVNSMEGDVASKPSRKTQSGQEHGKPSEFGLTSTRKLTVADLIPSVTDSRLKSSLKHLDSATSSRKSKSSGVPGKLEAPLPKRQQDRLERAAAYEKSKETLDRWIETVKANRRAEHLSFPLVDPSAQQIPRIDVAKPQTDLEQTIQNILVESGLAGSNEKSAEEQIKQAEELEAKKLSLEELRARRAELRKRRELLFREEVRAKRIKKIKSKSYRRVHRKEREKMAQLERQALIEAGVDLDEEERERLDRQRAEARMGKKHRESKWAKSLKETGRAAWDEEARLSVAEMARRDEELQRRIEGRRVPRDDDEFLGSSSSESDDDDDDDPWREETGSDAEARKLRKKLEELEADGGAAENVKGPHSKLLSMKFMQNAEAARKAQNDAEIKRLKRELQGDGSESEAESEVGRQTFGRSKAQDSEQPKPLLTKNEFEEPPGSDDEEETRGPEPDDGVQIVIDRPKGQIPARASRNAPQPREQKKSDEKEPVEEENPWLTQTSRNNRKRVTSTANETVDITLSGPASTSHETMAEVVKTQDKNDTKGQSTTQQPRKDDDDRSESDEEDRVPILLKNHDLVKKAFAGDDVTYDFEKEKLETIEEEGDKVIDNTLPGWGSWTGEGISKKQQKRQKRFLTTIEGVKPENRKDAKLSRVIINEKRVKKVKIIIFCSLTFFLYKELIC